MKPSLIQKIQSDAVTAHTYVIEVVNVEDEVDVAAAGRAVATGSQRDVVAVRHEAAFRSVVRLSGRPADVRTRRNVVIHQRPELIVEVVNCSDISWRYNIV